MATIKELKTVFKTTHDTLSASYYAGTSGLTKEQFDTEHAKVWKDLDIAVKGASDYVAPVPPRNLEAEIDALTAKVAKLEKPL